MIECSLSAQRRVGIVFVWRQCVLIQTRNDRVQRLVQLFVSTTKQILHQDANIYTVWLVFVELEQLKGFLWLTSLDCFWFIGERRISGASSGSVLVLAEASR